MESQVVGRKTINWIDYIIILLLIGFNLFLIDSIVSPLKTLPSPGYGGDYYHQLGCINNIKYGGNAFNNCNELTENPVYLPFYSILTSSISKFFGIDSMQAMFYMSYIIAALSTYIMYMLIIFLFKNRYIAIIGALLFTNYLPVFKYTDFGTIFMTPVLILFLYFVYDSNKYLDWINLGLIVGIANLTHTVYLPVTYFFVGVIFIMLYPKENKGRWIAKLVIFLAIAVPITLMYWYNPIFVHHMQTSPHYLEWNSQGDYNSFAVKWETVKYLSNAVIQYDTYINIIRLILICLCVFGLLVIKKQEYTKPLKYILIISISFIILYLSYFITMPLFGVHFIPKYIFNLIGPTIIIIMICFGLSFLENMNDMFIKKKLVMIIIFIILMGLFSYDRYNIAQNSKDNKFYKMGLEQTSPDLEAVKKFIIKNTKVNDVFLTAKETGFYINGLTGRKFLATRRAHNDPYENMDIRELDQAVILYGSDIEYKKSLIKKYNIKYLYWDANWINLEYSFDQQGNMVSWFDPLIAFNDSTYKNYLEQNEVLYFEKLDWVDPSYKNNMIPQFNLIFISPNNYRNFTHPWNPNLNQYLKKVWSYKQGDLETNIIYEVVINN